MPTTGAPRHVVASQATSGAIGSCTCTMSKSPSRSSARSRDSVSGKIESGETDPLALSPTVRESGTR